MVNSCEIMSYFYELREFEEPVAVIVVRKKKLINTEINCITTNLLRIPI